MKALSVLLVLVLSTPAYACTDPKLLAAALFNFHYEYVGIKHKQAVFINRHYQKYLLVEMKHKKACVVEEGSFL